MISTLLKLKHLCIQTVISPHSGHNFKYIWEYFGMFLMISIAKQNFIRNHSTFKRKVFLYKNEFQVGLGD